MPAATVLGHEAVLGQAREHPEQVVLLDAHLLGELGDRDPRALLDEGERLRAARTAGPGTATTPASARAAALCARPGRTRGPARLLGRRDAVKRGRRPLETPVTLHGG